MSNRGIVRKQKKYGRVYEYEPIERDVTLTEEKAENIDGAIRNANVLTPQGLAEQHKIRVSLARKILSKYEDEGIIHLKYKNGDEEIYRR